MAALPPSPYMPSQLASNRKTTLGPSRQLASSKRPDIYARNLQRTRTAELSNSAMAFLFSELVQHVQKQVSGIQDLERKLNEHGYRVGQRALELFVWREKNSKRETKVLGILQFVSSSLWKNLFGRQADALEKSREKEDEYMVIDNDPIINRFISVPKEMNQLNCAAFVAGIVEAVLDGSQFPCRVTAHSVATDAFPNRTVILIKLDQSVLERERQLYSH